MAVKRRREDIAFSLCIRERAAWRCQRCGKQFERGHAIGLDCSHYFGRRAASTRWWPDNCLAHCRGCHQHLGANPELFREHYIEMYGQDGLDRLREVHNDKDLGRRMNRRKLQIAQHFESEYERQLAQRADGNMFALAPFDPVPDDLLY